MRPWNEIIAEAKDKKDMTAAEINKQGAAALKEIRAEKKKESKDQAQKSKDRHYKLAKKREKRKGEQLKFTIDQSKKNAEEKKKQELENIKNKPKQVANAALSGIKTQSISSKDSDATAYTKAVGNVGSLVGGIAKAGIGYGIARHRAKKEAEAVQNAEVNKIPEKKPRKSGLLGGRPPGGSGSSPSDGGGASKKTGPVRPSIGTVTGPASNPKRPKKTGPVRPSIGTVTGPASNPKRPYNEGYSNWKEEFIVEVDDKDGKIEKKKIIDVMRGKNKIEINPNMKEEKDQEGGMAHNELATMERAVKTLRKKIKSPNQQLPAWVQSKISKAVDHIDSVADYMSGETEPVSEECGCEDDGKKVLAMMIIKKAVDAKKKKNSQLNSGIIGEESPAWQRKEGKNPEGGLNAKGRASAKAQGHNLKPPVTTPPSKLDPDSKSAKRRKSFCARMGGMPGPMKDEKGRPTRKALSLRKWNC